jgi:hypothetical protein
MDACQTHQCQKRPKQRQKRPMDKEIPADLPSPPAVAPWVPCILHYPCPSPPLSFQSLCVYVCVREDLLSLLQK